MTNKTLVDVTVPQASETDEGVHLPAPHGTRRSAACEHLLDAALELFAERGFEATTTKLIAQRAGVPHGLIHYHFGTKHNLLVSLLTERSFLPEIETRFEAARASGSTDPRSTLIECCVELCASYQRHKPLACIMRHESQVNPEVRAALLQLEGRVFKLIADFLEGASQQGAFRMLDAEMVAQALLSTLSMNIRHENISEPRAFCERLVDALVSK